MKLISHAGTALPLANIDLLKPVVAPGLIQHSKNKFEVALASEIDDPPLGHRRPEDAVPGKFKACVIVPVLVFAVIVAALLK